MVYRKFFYEFKDPLEIHAFQKLCEKQLEEAKEQLIRK